MKVIKLIALASIVVAAGCEQTTESNLLDDSTSEGQPIVSIINAEGAPIDAAFKNHGWEYWLYNAKAKGTGYVSYGDQNYQPYGGDGDEFNHIKPSEHLRRCMRQGSDTLNKILANPPAEYTAFRKKYQGRFLKFFGWIDDYHTLTENTVAHNAKAKAGYKGSFNWTGNDTYPGSIDYKVGGYIKWSGTLAPDGTCTTPSEGELLDLIKTMDNCETNPGESCLEI